MKHPRSSLGWLVAGTLLLSATVVRADAIEGGGWHHGMHGWGGWFFGPMMMLLFFVLLVVAAVVISRLLGRERSGGAKRADGALDILRQRFAKGEITSAEFEEMRRVLE